MDPIYLQTVEAYREYLSHLADDGILQINYYVYPRMLTTAAQAWHDLFPDRDFARHVIIEGSGWSEFMMPTLLVKRSRWTPEEIAAARALREPAVRVGAGPELQSRVRAGPAGGGQRAGRVLPRAAEPALAARLPYQVAPTTDARPFFRDLRKQAPSDRARRRPATCPRPPPASSTRA